MYFKENEEAGFFGDADEMAKQAGHYLANDSLRERIQYAGYQRALKDHSLDERAKTVIGHMKKLM